MKKLCSLLVMAGAMLAAGQSGSILRSGQNADSCTGHDGVFTCKNVDPKKTCKGIDAYIAGANESGLKNKKADSTQVTCASANDDDADCVGTAVKYDTFSCEEIKPVETTTTGL